MQFGVNSESAVSPCEWGEEAWDFAEEFIVKVGHGIGVEGHCKVSVWEFVYVKADYGIPYFWYANNRWGNSFALQLPPFEFCLRQIREIQQTVVFA